MHVLQPMKRFTSIKFNWIGNIGKPWNASSFGILQFLSKCLNVICVVLAGTVLACTTVGSAFAGVSQCCYSTSITEYSIFSNGQDLL